MLATSNPALAAADVVDRGAAGVPATPGPQAQTDSAPPPVSAENATVAEPAETMAVRELRAIIAREEGVWARLRENPDAMSETLRAEAEFRNILTAYENLLHTNREFAEGYAAYGLLLSRTGNREEAAKAFLRANKLNPGLPLVKNQLGNYLAEDGNYKEALPYYLAAIELKDDEPLYHYQLGTLLYEFRDFFVADELYTRGTLEKEMQSAFRRAAELAPDQWAFTYRYAESFYDLTEPDWPRALDVWEQLQGKAAPGVEEQTILLHRARILAEMNRSGEARALLGRVNEPVLETNKQTVIDLLEPEPAK